MSAEPSSSRHTRSRSSINAIPTRNPSIRSRTRISHPSTQISPLKSRAPRLARPDQDNDNGTLESGVEDGVPHQLEPSDSLTPSSSSPKLLKGTRKQPELEKRVMPQRIRRAAGGGAEGIRDLEEMIVDWLERFGAPCTTPPDDLPIYLSNLPLSELDPPTYTTVSKQTAPEVTLTPSRNGFVPSLEQADGGGRIETPSWVMVKPGEDDAEEAREEMERAKSVGLTSPLKRLRKGHIEDASEDTSDNYYIALHKKYETFERRQRIREKEKLQFERYKMRSRIELLRSMGIPGWNAVVMAVLSRGVGWDAGREKLREEGFEWLKGRLLKEGAEVMKRYDQLLPVEQRKKNTDGRFSTPTPSRISSSPSLSPAPAVLPARVAALRDQLSASRRKSGSNVIEKEHSPLLETKSPVVYTSRNSPRKRKRSASTSLHEAPHEPSKASRRVPRRSSHTVPPPLFPSDQTEILDQSQPPSPPSPKRSRSPFFPPQTQSGLPCLVEAASRRESAIDEITSSRLRAAQQRAEAVVGKRNSRLIAREKTRGSERLGLVLPFGVAVPGVVEYKSEFTLSDEEDFWPVISAREAHATHQRRMSLLNPTDVDDKGIFSASAPSAVGSGSSQDGLTMAMVSKEDIAEMGEVEAAVVI